MTKLRTIMIISFLILLCNSLGIAQLSDDFRLQSQIYVEYDEIIFKMCKIYREAKLTGDVDKSNELIMELIPLYRQLELLERIGSKKPEIANVLKERNESNTGIISGCGTLIKTRSKINREADRWKKYFQFAVVYGISMTIVLIGTILNFKGKIRL